MSWMPNFAILLINEDTPASNCCPAYLETFPEPENEACQSLGFPHSDNRIWHSNTLILGQLMLGFPRNRQKGHAVKNLAGALHTDVGECRLSVGWEVKMEIPD
jgi:hypothetical protein